MLLSTPRSWLAGSAYTVPLRYERLITILQEVAYTHATDEHSQGEGIIHVFTDSVFHNPTQYRSYTVENTSLPCLAPPSSNHVYSKTVLIPQLGRLSCPVLSAFCSVHLCQSCFVNCGKYQTPTRETHMNASQVVFSTGKPVV